MDIAIVRLFSVFASPLKHFLWALSKMDMRDKSSLMYQLKSNVEEKQNSNPTQLLSCVCNTTKWMRKHQFCKVNSKGLANKSTATAAAVYCWGSEDLCFDQEKTR